jgi:hypothetical protein
MKCVLDEINGYENYILLILDLTIIFLFLAPLSIGHQVLLLGIKFCLGIKF